MEGLPSKWSKLGLSARQFAKRIGVTYSMAEFVVYGHQHPPCQPKASKNKSLKDHKEIMQVTSLKPVQTVSDKVGSSQRYSRAMARTRAHLKRYRPTGPKIKFTKSGQTKKKSNIVILLNDKLSVSPLESKTDKILKSPSYAKPISKPKFKKWSVTNMSHKGKPRRSRRRYVRKHTRNKLSWKRWCRSMANKIKGGRLPLRHIQARRQRKPKSRKVHSAVQVPSILIREDSGLPLPIQCLEFPQVQEESNNPPGAQDRMTQRTATQCPEREEACENIFQEHEEKMPADDDDDNEDEEDNEWMAEEEGEESISYGWSELFRSWLLSLETYFRI